MGDPSPPALRATTTPVPRIDTATRERMFALFSGYYDAVERGRFLADLDGKDHAILLHDPHGVLRGFSTLTRMTVQVSGTVHHAVYSGDTVIEATHWGGNALGRAFLAYMLRARARHPLAPLWWFLISKGYKTYLMMANNFHEHWPRHETHTPQEVRSLLDAFARARFGDAYDPTEGVVRHDESLGHLKDEVAGIDAELAASNPRIAYFAHRNPGWSHGDELVCLARMEWTMPLRYAWKKRQGARWGP